MLRADFQELAVGANQQGSGSGIDSATEAGVVEKRTQIREGDKIGQVMEFVNDAGRKLDQVVQANITKDQAVKGRLVYEAGLSLAESGDEKGALKLDEQGIKTLAGQKA